MKNYIIFVEHDGSKRVATVASVHAIMKKHGYPRFPDGSYRITPAMIIEAQALDRAAGDEGPPIELIEQADWVAFENSTYSILQVKNGRLSKLLKNFAPSRRLRDRATAS